MSAGIIRRMPMPENAAAIWSAIAASFAALSSLLILRVQRRSLLASVRPELVLVGWSRSRRGEGERKHDVIAFREVKNVGRGPALHVVINCLQLVNNRPTAVLNTARLPILANNESVEISGEIVIAWKNVVSSPDKALGITIQIYAWDLADIRHETLYQLIATETPGSIDFGDEIAPGVALGSRTTNNKAVWLLKSRARFEWIAGIRRILNKRN